MTSSRREKISERKVRKGKKRAIKGRSKIETRNEATLVSYNSRGVACGQRDQRSRESAEKKR